MNNYKPDAVDVGSGIALLLIGILTAFVKFTLWACKMTFKGLVAASKGIARVGRWLSRKWASRHPAQQPAAPSAKAEPVAPAAFNPFPETIAIPMPGAIVPVRATATALPPVKPTRIAQFTRSLPFTPDVAEAFLYYYEDGGVRRVLKIRDRVLADILGFNTRELPEVKNIDFASEDDLFDRTAIDSSKLINGKLKAPDPKQQDATKKAMQTLGLVQPQGAQAPTAPPAPSPQAKSVNQGGQTTASKRASANFKSSRTSVAQAPAPEADQAPQEMALQFTPAIQRAESRGEFTSYVGYIRKAGDEEKRNHRTGEKYTSFCVVLEDERGNVMPLFGTDLERALEVSGVTIGDRVRVEQRGWMPTSVPSKNGAGFTRATKKIYHVERV
jgi:hypothetical protein